MSRLDIGDDSALAAETKANTQNNWIPASGPNASHTHKTLCKSYKWQQFKSTQTQCVFVFARLRFLPNNHHSYHNRHPIIAIIARFVINNEYNFYWWLWTRARSRNAATGFVYRVFVCLLNTGKMFCCWSSTQQPSTTKQLAYRSNVSFIITLLSSVVKFVHTHTFQRVAERAECMCITGVKLKTLFFFILNACLWNMFILFYFWMNFVHEILEIL